MKYFLYSQKHMRVGTINCEATWLRQIKSFKNFFKGILTKAIILYEKLIDHLKIFLSIKGYFPFYNTL